MNLNITKKPGGNLILFFGGGAILGYLSMPLKISSSVHFPLGLFITSVHLLFISEGFRFFLEQDFTHIRIMSPLT